MEHHRSRLFPVPRREMDQSLYQQRMQEELGAAASLELGQNAAHHGGGDQHHGGAASQVP